MLSSSYWRFINSWGSSFKFANDDMCMTMGVA
jgi:hypothetical protein